MAAELVAEIESDIMARGWPVGQIIGTFAELIEKYSVSRAVVREAVGLLEHKKIVRMKHGPGGGVEVRAPIAAAVVEALGSYFDFVDVPDRDLVEMRGVLWGLAARRAAENIDAEGIARVTAMIDRVERIEYEAESVRPQREFYPLLVDLSKNPAIRLFAVALGRRAIEKDAALDPPREILEKIHARQMQTLEAIGAGDAKRAQWLMIALSIEVDEARKRLEVEAGQNGSRNETPSETIARDTDGKLPSRVARWIKREILRNELQPGDVVGFERDLLESLEVSRSVFREAVRVVEFYGLAEMRRGPKGGLTVCEPDPKQMEDTVISYLKFIGIELRHLFDVRMAVELANVRWTIERSEADLESLGELIESELAHGRRRPMEALHAKLAELTKNRASAFLSAILARSTDREIGLERERRASSSEESQDRVARAHAEHAAIVEAIRSRDVAGAQDRMLCHLRGVASAFEEFEPER